MTELTNHDRAAFAARALDGFQKDCPCDTEDALADLLCDLMHYANQTSFDFDAELARARMHFEAELEEEAP